jgi:hypothetical protein
MAEMEALRACTSSPFSSKSVHSLDSNSSEECGFVSLIKYVPSSAMWESDMEQTLVDFYINGICPGRTVATQSNTYLSLLPLANACVSTRFALLSVAASYIREHLPSQKDMYHQAELYYSMQALQTLTAQISTGTDYEGAVATSMLLMHHSAFDDENSPLCWSCHASIFDIIPPRVVDLQSDMVFFIRTQLVLARTAQTCSQLQTSQFYSIEKQGRLECASSPEAQKICAMLGLSPMLSFLIFSTTSLAVNTTSPDRLLHAQVLEAQLLSMHQWTEEIQLAEQEVILKTAEAFRLAAIMYLRTRIYG